MLRTVAQSFAPVAVESEASLGLLLEELKGLLRSGLRLDVTVRASSSVGGGGGCVVVHCQDCGVKGHASRRYGGCAFYSVPRSGSPPRRVGRQRSQPGRTSQTRTFAEVAASTLNTPPSTTSRSSGEIAVSQLLEVPKQPSIRRSAPRRTATPPSPTFSPPRRTSGTPPVVPAVTVSPPPFGSPSSSALATAALNAALPPVSPDAAIPPGTSTPLPSDAEEDSLLTPRPSRERLDRMEVLKSRCGKYFNPDGTFVDRWEELLRQDWDEPEKFLDIAEYVQLIPTSTSWPDVIHNMCAAVEDYAFRREDIYSELQRRVRDVRGQSRMAEWVPLSS